MGDKPAISLGLVGTRGSGKTTVLGHLCRLQNGFEEGRLAECLDLAKELGCPTGASAWMLDSDTAERELAMTLMSTHTTFDSDAFRYTAVDLPGDRLLKGLFGAASSVDIAVLCVSAAAHEFEVSTDLATPGNIKEVALSCITMGIKHIVVCVTKMDHLSVDYDQTRFEEIKKVMLQFLKEVGYKQKEPIVIPVSAITSEVNLTSKSQETPFYAGSPLLDSVDSLSKEINRPAEKPLRLPIIKVHDVPGTGTVCVGRVETGSIKTGNKIMFAPGGELAEVESLQIGDKSVAEASTGDVVSFSVGDAIASTDVKRGMVVSSKANDPAADAESFLAQVIILEHPGSIRAGYTPAICIGPAQVACEFEELVAKIDRKTGKEAEKSPATGKSGEVVTAILRPRAPMVAEAFSAYPPLGRFAVRDHGRTIAVGVVKEVTKRPLPKRDD